MQAEACVWSGARYTGVYILVHSRRNDLTAPHLRRHLEAKARVWKPTVFIRERGYVVGRSAAVTRMSSDQFSRKRSKIRDPLPCCGAIQAALIPMSWSVMNTREL